MENASKALVIAGEVLIALLVISLLVFFYNTIKDFRNTEELLQESEQAIEYNKQYDVYYRNNLYGSDILSLANKIYDYNKRESEAEGYARLEMEVTFKSNITINDKEVIISKKEIYTSENLKSVVQYLEDTIDKYGNEKFLGNTIKLLSAYRTMELKQLLGLDNIPTAVETKIVNYQRYKSSLVTLKSKTFKANNFEYDKSTGRITLMRFTEN